MVRPLASLRRLLTGDEIQQARDWQERVARAASREGNERRAFAERMRAHPGDIRLGRGRDADDTPLWIGLPSERLLGMHSWVTGATGSGKSYFVLGALLQVLALGRHPVVVLDCKGELADLLVEVVIPALCHSPGAQRLVENLRIVRPFDRTYLPMLRI